MTLQHVVGDVVTMFEPRIPQGKLVHDVLYIPNRSHQRMSYAEALLTSFLFVDFCGDVAPSQKDYGLKCHLVAGVSGARHWERVPACGDKVALRHYPGSHVPKILHSETHSR